MDYRPLVPELQMADIEKSLAFYVDLLGFEVKYARPENGFYFIEREGAQIMIEQLTPDERFTNGLPEIPFGRGMNFEIETADVDALYDRITAANYPVFIPIEDKWYRTGDVMGGTRQFIVADPSGYLLRFCQDMGTRPL